MSPSRITESVVEEAALDWLESLDWAVAHGPDIAPDTLAAQRDVLLPKLVAGEEPEHNSIEKR